MEATEIIPEYTYLESVINVGDYSTFVDRFPGLFSVYCHENEKFSQLVEIYTKLLKQNPDLYWKQCLIELIKKIPHEINQDYRNILYSKIIASCKESDIQEFDWFLDNVARFESSREISRIIYQNSPGFGEARSSAVFNLLRNLIGAIPEFVTPTICYSGSGPVCLFLPNQKLPLHYENTQCSYQIITTESQTHSFPLTKKRTDNFIITESLEVDLPEISTEYKILFDIDGVSYGPWVYEGITSDRPFLAFDISTGILNEESTLKRKPLWIITEYTPLTRVGVLEEGIIPGVFSSFYSYLIDPGESLNIIFLSPDKKETYQIPFDKPINSIMLTGGSPCTNLPIASLDPWFTKTPGVSIVYGDLNFVRNGSLHLESKTPASPVINKTISFEEETEYLAINIENQIIDVNINEILNPDPSDHIDPIGRYSVSAPGIEKSLTFNVVPELSIRFIPPFTVSGPNSCKDFKFIIEGPDVIEDSPNGCDRLGAHSRTYEYRVRNTDRTHIDTGITYLRPGSKTPLNFRLSIIPPIIRWSIMYFGGNRPIRDTDKEPYLLKEDISKYLSDVNVSFNCPDSLTIPLIVRIGSKDVTLGKRDKNNEIILHFTKFFGDILREKGDITAYLLSRIEGIETKKYPLFSVIDWTIKDILADVLTEEQYYRIGVSWKDRGRNKNITIAIYDEQKTFQVENVRYTPSRLEPTRLKWTDMNAEIEVPISVPEGVYLICFLRDEDNDGWGNLPYSHDIPVFLSKNPYLQACWHFNTGRLHEANYYDICLQWLDKVESGFVADRDFSLLKGKALGLSAESPGKTSKERVEILNEARELIESESYKDTSDTEVRLTLAFILNRLAHYDEGSKNRLCRKPFFEDRQVTYHRKI